METSHDNLTLTEADLAACRPIVGEGGHVLRALCPFHGSDRQRSLRVQVHSGRFVCFACGAWGYMETAREHWREEQQREAAFQRPPARRQRDRADLHRRLRVQGSPRLGHRCCLHQLQARPTWRSRSPPSKPPCRAAAEKPTCSSAAFLWRWRNSWGWATRRRVPGRTQSGIGVKAAWCFPIPHLPVSW